MKTYCVVDLEATCWEYNDPDKQDNETIEIGAVLLDEHFNKLKDISIITLPLINTQLTEYCTDLTSITQEMLDTKGISFPAGIEILREFINSDTIFCSWGYYDKKQLKKDCEAWSVPYPFSEEHINIKQEFMSKLNRKRCGLQKACRILHLRFNGTPHRGIDDAHMIAEVFKILRSMPTESA